MTWLRRRWGRLEALSIFFAFIAVLLFTISAWSAWDNGWLALISVAFGYLLMFLMLHGIFVLWTVRNNGRGSFRNLMLWLLTASLVLAVLTLVGVHLGYGEIFLDNGLSIDSVLGNVVASIELFILIFITSILLVAVACSAMWFFSKSMLFIVPTFLSDVRSVTYQKGDAWYKTLEIRLVDFPRVLDPSSIRLEAQAMDNRSARSRFLQELLWQMALGVLLVTYIGLNPLILENISFSQIFILVIITSLIVPMLVLPWSILEVLGARASGTRVDFFLSKGARMRMIETLLALGTLLLILRLAVEEMGWETIAWTFSGYILGLFFISALFSFVYFHFFEVRLIEGLRQKLGERGF